MKGLIYLLTAFTLLGISEGLLNTTSPPGWIPPGGPRLGVSVKATVKGAKVQSELLKVLSRNVPERNQPNANRSPRQAIARTGGHSHQSSSNQNHPFYSKPGNPKPNFETYRGKNWCAYVHTRLSPTVTMDSVQTYVSMSAQVCPWNTRSCQPRYQIMNRPAYRMKHKIVTSLEWRCCPGYTGAKCEPKEQQLKRQAEENQAESHVAVETPRDQQHNDPALTAKFSDKLYNQETKLGLLQKKVENISASMNDVQSVLLSLEGKMNEDSGKDPQSTSKVMKSKGIQDLVKELVFQQTRAFQENIQESVAQLYKVISSLTEELESTKATIKQLNKSISSQPENFSPDPKKQDPAVNSEIQEIREQVILLRAEVSLTCNNTSQDIQEEIKSLDGELVKEQERNSVFFDIINRTLSQVGEAQKQLISEQSLRDIDTAVPEIGGAQKNTRLQNYFLSLVEKVRAQNHMIVKLYAKLNTQDAQLSNLTNAGGRHDELATTCQDLIEESNSNLQNQLHQMQNHTQYLNATFFNIFTSFDDAMESVNERISNLAYDMEILQPIAEEERLALVPPDEGHRSDVAALRKRLEVLSSRVERLGSVVKDVAEERGLRSNSGEEEETFNRFMAECRLEIEDGLNDTMIVLNDAVDSIRDNYYVLKKNLTDLRQYVMGLPYLSVANQKDCLALIPQFKRLNDSFMVLLDDMVRHQNALETMGAIKDIADIENELSNLPNIVMMSDLLNGTAVKTEDHQQMIQHLEEMVLQSPAGTSDHEARILALESKLESTLANSKSFQKSKKTKKLEKTKPPAPKYQELRRKLSELDSKCFKLGDRVSMLSEETGHTWGFCQNLSVSVAQINARIPLLVSPEAKLNATNHQEQPHDFTQSISEATGGGVFLTNVTEYMDNALSVVIGNITKLQRQMKQIYKKQAVTVKPNVTAGAGRSQRYADTNDDSVEPASCSSSPCQNGGTCINQGKGFVCACRPPFGGPSCDIKLLDENALKTDFSRGSYRYAPMVTFFVAHTYSMSTPGPIKFNHLMVNYGASYAPGSGKFLVPYLGVYVFKYTIESSTQYLSGYLVVDGVDKLAFQSEHGSGSVSTSRVVTGDAVLELNYGQRVWLRLMSGSIPAKYPPVTTFGGYLLYRT
uniref:Multimerin 1 n=1 Tax=Callorhinchus milii TaxID=7868 RepID=A0A4W3IX98_CALMI|eukprot:gi/632968780/ref/XP_007900716.1/ PREDICTED: multimerin-1 [Callorhinchus milii]